jgi:endonuclease/exonuclease/phosphatase (EEP) superfamily protein YafD
LRETIGIVTYARRAAQPLFAAVILSAACRPASVQTIPATPALAAVVTWNMGAGRGDLRRLVADLEAGRLGGGRPSAWLFLLQEAVEGDLHTIADPRGWPLFFVPVRDDGGRTRGNAILSSRPILNPRTIPLPRERQPRAAAAASIDVDGRRLFVVSAHLENRASWWTAGLLSDAARRRQVDALLQVLPPGERGILGGDFNTWLGPNEPAWQALAKRFGGTPGARRTPTFGNRLILDHLFFDLPADWRVASRVVPDAYESDHHPVIGTITRIDTPEQVETGK